MNKLYVFTYTLYQPAENARLARRYLQDDLNDSVYDIANAGNWDVEEQERNPENEWAFGWADELSEEAE